MYFYPVVSTFQLETSHQETVFTIYHKVCNSGFSKQFLLSILSTNCPQNSNAQRMKIDQAAAAVKDLRDQLYEKDRLIEIMKCKIEQDYTALVRCGDIHFLFILLLNEFL